MQGMCGVGLARVPRRGCASTLVDHRDPEGHAGRGGSVETPARDERAEGVLIPVGDIDINLYRDDLGTIGPLPVVGESSLPSSGIDDQVVVLVDDVLFTGRTIRAALNEVMDWGRPSRILLCVLADRGGRELPVQPDVVGRSIDVLEGQQVEVLVPELDGRLGVDLVSTAPEAA